MAEELAQSLPTPTLPPAGKKLGVKDIIGFQEPYLTRKTEIQKGITGAEGAEAQAKQTQAETLATGKADVEKAFGEAERGAMQRYQGQLEKEPLPAFIPSKETTQDMAQLFSVVNVLGMLLGGGGKQNAQIAMNAMNGMLEGHQKGRQDLYRQERDTFEKNFKSMLQKHSEFRKEMEDAIKLASTNKQAGLAAAELAATKAGSSIVQAQLRKGDLVGAYKLVDESQKGANEALKFVERQQEREATEAAAERRQRETLASQERLRLATLAVQQGRRDEKALQSVGPALRNIAEQYPEGTVNTLLGASPDDKKRVQGAFRAVEESESVGDFVARNPGAVGAMAVVRNFLKMDAIASLQNPDEAQAAQQKSLLVDDAIDKGVQSGQIKPDDAQAAKILQKKLFGLALSDVQGSGQRGSVYLDKSFQSLYDQASRPETLLKIIRERAEENNRNLKTYKLNIERHNNPEQFPLLESKSIEDYAKERRPATGVPKDVEDRLKGKPDGTGVRKDGKIFRTYGGVVSEAKE
jgi:hypothetical protein